MLKKIRYGLEGAGLFAGLVFFRLLPLDMASALGGRLGRLIGPLTRAHRVAQTNLLRALPEMSKPARRRCLGEMWDNLGRTMGEYPHLNRPIMRRRITIEGREHLERVKQSSTGALFVSGHFANWEIVSLAAALYDLSLVVIYRAPNNPVADWLIRSIRGAYNNNMVAKGRDGAVQSIKALKAGKAVAMLIDQKMNDGKPVDFFGHPAMTAISVTQLAIKFQVPLLAARVVRTDGAHFHVTLMPPKYYDVQQSPQEAMEALHRQFEQWIREYPAQWFWIHNRWNWEKKPSDKA